MVPLFFHDGVLATGTQVDLQEDTAKHIVQVLRMQVGDSISLTNGKGGHAHATISSTQKKHCTVTIGEAHVHEAKQPAFHLAVAFTKNSSRNEWILEKATELGVATIIPLQTSRSEREKFRYDRWKNILISAILQSKQYHLPNLTELTSLDEVVKTMGNIQQQLVAHCIDGVVRKPLSDAMQKDKETLLLIGPEGDFTNEEVNNLTSKGYAGVSLGENRLRTETAAVAACAYFNMLNNG